MQALPDLCNPAPFAGLLFAFRFLTGATIECRMRCLFLFLGLIWFGLL